MSMHPDGSRTVYNFDNAQHTAMATTTDPDGKVRQTIHYQLDNAGHFSTGEVSGPDGRVRLKSRYKYDDGGHLLEEVQSAADGTPLHKIVYSYDSAGKQTGYSGVRRLWQTSQPHRRRRSCSPVSIAKTTTKDEAMSR
jgi:hypothetical protein